MIKKVLSIIVDYHSSKDAENLSLQLAQEANQNFEHTIIHVDNGNSQPVQLTQEQKSYSIRLIRNSENLGYAGALHSTILELEKQGEKFDAYWFLNSDLEVKSGCLAGLVETLNQDSQIGAVGPIIRITQKKEVIWGARGRVSPLLGTTAMEGWNQDGALPHWSYIPGCSLLVRAKSYWDVGGIPTFYKLYFEETELCIHLQKKGWKLWVDQNSTIYHRVDSLKGGIPARHFAYYFIRNNLTFWKRNFGIPTWVQLPRTLYVAFREVVLPLRRASSFSEVWDRLIYLGAGIWDGILFSRQSRPRFENRLFP
jgi:GT2 family glycosyltransferase